MIVRQSVRRQVGDGLPQDVIRPLPELVGDLALDSIRCSNVGVILLTPSEPISVQGIPVNDERAESSANIVEQADREG